MVSPWAGDFSFSVSDEYMHFIKKKISLKEIYETSSHMYLEITMNIKVMALFNRCLHSTLCQTVVNMLFKH